MKRLFVLCCAFIFLITFDGKRHKINEASLLKSLSPNLSQARSLLLTPPHDDSLTERVVARTSVPRRPRATKGAQVGSNYPSKQVPPLESPFWRYLSNCESASNVDGKYKGYFQFAQDSWDRMAKRTPEMSGYLGVNPSTLSFELQKLGAWHWANIISSPGGRAGWKTCWPIALRELDNN